MASSDTKPLKYRFKSSGIDSLEKRITQEKIPSEKLFAGEDIINFSNGNFEKKATRDCAKTIMRKALDFHLGNKTLNIRKYLSKN